jgi:hypothetical protein
MTRFDYARVSTSYEEKFDGTYDEDEEGIFITPEGMRLLKAFQEYVNCGTPPPKDFREEMERFALFSDLTRISDELFEEKRRSSANYKKIHTVSSTLTYKHNHNN